jgi:hypothetical protein
LTRAFSPKNAGVLKARLDLLESQEGFNHHWRADSSQALWAFIEGSSHAHQWAHRNEL